MNRISGKIGREEIAREMFPSRDQFYVFYQNAVDEMELSVTGANQLSHNLHVQLENNALNTLRVISNNLETDISSFLCPVPVVQPGTAL